MNPRPNTSEWMWGHALDLMAEAERLHRQFFRVAGPARASAAWEPPMDVFEDAGDIVVVVALPGVSESRLEILRDDEGLVVRAERPLAFGDARFTVRRLEIPYGEFRRRIPLPPGRFELVARELARGCLHLRLRKVD